MQLTKHWAATLDDYVIDLGWSPDGALLAAASAAGPVSIFAAADGAKRHELPGHENGTNCLAWQPGSQETGDRGQGTGDRKPEPGSPNSKPKTQNPELPIALLATGGQDGAVKFWDATAGQHTATAKLGNAWVEHLAWRPIVKPDVRGQESEVRGQESDVSGQRSDVRGEMPEDRSQETGDRRQATGSSALSTVARPLSPVLFAAAGRTLAAIRPDATIAHTFAPAPKTIAALAAQPAGGCVAVAYFGGVVLWDADDFTAQKEFPYANGIHALVWSPDNRWLVSGNQDPSVHLWIPETDVELHMSGYETKVKFMSFDHTSRWLATSGGRDGCVWDCSGAGPENREPAMLPHEAPICAVKFQHAHGLVAVASQDGIVRLWSPERRQPLRVTIKMPSAATKLAWSPDDGSLAIGSEKGVVYVLKCEG